MVLNSSKMANTEEETRWLHSDADLLSGHGITYNVNVIILFIFLLFIELFSLLKYLGSVEVLCSMKTLDFESRTRVARDSIRLVCAAIGVTLKERRKVNI
jgi:hypothetical protein